MPLLRTMLSARDLPIIPGSRASRVLGGAPRIMVRPETSPAVQERPSPAIRRFAGSAGDPLSIRSARPSPPIPPLFEGGAPPPEFVTSPVNEMDRTPEIGRAGTGGYTHVSELINMCIRQHYLARAHSIEIRNNTTGGHRVMWALGRAAEHHVRTQFLRTRNNRDAWGWWQCNCGQTSRLGEYQAEECPACRLLACNYREPCLEDDEYMLSGSPDLTLIGDNQVFMPVEIKSMAIDRWRVIQAPMIEHALQVLMYRWLHERNGRGVHSHVALVYVAKDFVFGSPYKEFHVDSRTPDSLRLVSEALELALELKNATVAGMAPPRTVCRLADSARARNCPVSTLCFNLR